MFTGIITEIGRVKSKIGNLLVISAEKTVSRITNGDSVSVNGVCVTVIDAEKSAFRVNLLGETMEKTNLGRIKPGDLVNLESALKAGEKISGHLVTGHVDCQGKLIRNYRKSDDRILELEVPHHIKKYLVPKGSIAIDGVSLTLVRVTGNRFSAHLIPYTINFTTLGNKRPGSLLNIEVDILARYAKGQP